MIFPAGAICQRPCSGVPRSAAKQAGESNRGKHSQSIEPSEPDQGRGVQIADEGVLLNGEWHAWFLARRRETPANTRKRG